MESSEIPAADLPRGPQETQIVEAMANDVDRSTFPTAEPARSTPPGKDGSVVSGLTDHGSVMEYGDGNGVQDVSVPQDEDDAMKRSPSSSPEVPSQVVVSEDNNDAASAPTLPISSPSLEPLVVTTTPTDGDSTVSMSAIPDPPPALKMDATDMMKPHGRSVDDTFVDSYEAKKEDDAFDEYIRSPEVQNAIVERSPGGRYVRFMEKLGSGASKDVYRAYDTQEGIEVAWNVVNLSGVPKTERNRIVNEVRLLERLHHHNIISFHGSWVNRERQEVIFMTEILSSGTLKSFINKVQVIRWKIAKRWAVQILNGLEYLHSQDPPVIHRDLKCENIFINGTSGDLRIGDLGLSTVHRNGRVLSVLGTPEFMAPDMYEEHSYDEKVDIYAFGMCMLEIFTKEIPYSECKNPAQIYKKVSSGEPPEVLRRLQSKHARDFVLLCLGYKDEEGRYVRPSATELLQHPFLLKRENDDDEVGVDRPLRERAISEVGESQTSPGSSPATKSKPPQPVDVEASAGPTTVASQPTQGTENLSEQVQPTKKTPPHPQRERANSLDDSEDGDQFDDMPQSETNMKKVKVLMGRGQELEEDDAPDQNEQTSVPSNVVAETDVAPVAAAAVPVPSANTEPAVSAPAVAPQVPTPAQHYLVAAAVIGNESSDTRPYPDDVLKLVVTLPVEGQTQNVQFDFHLVEDDPVQVAKEMVQELGIPPGAVLEISETISGLARVARMKIDKFNSGRRQAPAPIHAMAPQHGVAQPMQGQGGAVNQIHQGVQQQMGPPQTVLVDQGVQQQMHGQPMQQQQMSPPQNAHVDQGVQQQSQQMHGQPMQQQMGQPQGQGQQQMPPPQNVHVEQAVQQQSQPMHGQPMQQQMGQTQGQHQMGPPQNVRVDQTQQQLHGQPQQIQQQMGQAQGQGQHQMGPPQNVHLDQTQQQLHGQPMQQQMRQGQPHNVHGNQGGVQQMMHGQTMPQQMYIHHHSMPYGAPNEMQLPPQQLHGQVPQHQQQHMPQMQQPQYASHPQGMQHPGGQGGGMQLQTGSYGSHPMHQQDQQYAQNAPQQGMHMQQHGGQSMNAQQMATQLPPSQHGQGMQQQQHESMQGMPQQQQHVPPQNSQIPQQHMQPQGMHAQQHSQQHLQQPSQGMPQAQQDGSQGMVPHLQPMVMPQHQDFQSQNYAQQTQSQHSAPVQGVSVQMTPNVSQPQHRPTASMSTPPQVGQLQFQAVDDSSLGDHAMSLPDMSQSRSQSLLSCDSGQLPPRTVQRSSTAGTSTDASSPSNSDHRRRNLSLSSALTDEGISEPFDPSTSSTEGDGHGDPELDSELRRLEEDFQRNLNRAKKVFDNRMDNLQRSQIEREAQHLKTLEKHEKERAEFERRLAQEEEQQNRRIEQLQREWEKKRETLAQQKRRQMKAVKALHASQNGTHSMNSVDSYESMPMPQFPPPMSAGSLRHQRSDSMTSQDLSSGGGMHRRAVSSSSMSPGTSEHPPTPPPNTEESQQPQQQQE